MGQAIVKIVVLMKNSYSQKYINIIWSIANIQALIKVVILKIAEILE